jgi:iron complex transport system substrate-binding protein
LGLAVYATDPRNVEQIVASAQRLGELLKAGDRGQKTVAALNKRLDELRPNLKVPQPRNVFFVVWQTPLISVGRNTFLADALRWAGARSIVNTSQDWPEVSMEEIVKLQPDYLIFTSDEPDKFNREIAQLRGRPGWRDLRALRENHIILLSEAINRPAPRLLDAVEQLARALHPAPSANAPAAKFSAMFESSPAGAL